ncbi:MAG TPA: hypothetical protein VH164_16825 [Ktedonobacteraceae bacterium]|jgi:hypothetical protein|nr:hypothetical protein [Ktedonobacteraceae bacterium]
MLTGWKTVLFGLATAVGPTVLDKLAGIDWHTIGVSPTAGGIIGAIIIGLRAVTSTPIGRSE